MGKFVIKTGKDNQFYFSLKANNGEIILRSEGYKTRSSCVNGIESVRKNAVLDARFAPGTSKSGKPYFNLKAGNHQVIGTSETYETEKAMRNGMESVRKNAPDAKVEEEK